MIVNIDILYTKIGTKDNDDKLDCLYPIYLVYPNLPRYGLNHDPDYVYSNILKHFKPVKTFKAGDLILFKFKNKYHFGIYTKNNIFCHFLSKGNLRLTNINKYKKYINGVYRQWFKQ